MSFLKAGRLDNGFDKASPDRQAVRSIRVEQRREIKDTLSFNVPVSGGKNPREREIPHQPGLHSHRFTGRKLLRSLILLKDQQVPHDGAKKILVRPVSASSNSLASAKRPWTTNNSIK
jgi:hypothetical protein